MKKAFMRGVCALNLEAMTMFQEPEGTSGTVPEGRLYCRPRLCTSNNITYYHYYYFCVT